MTSERHPDPVAPETTPRELRLYGTGGWFMGIGAAVTVILWAVNVREPLPHEAYTIAVTTSIMSFLTGLVFAVISNAARWVVKVLTREHEETRRHTEEIVTGVAEVAAELRGQLAMVAAQVGRNGYLSNQLLAARTVDLVELQDKLEGVARDLTVNAIRDLEKSSASRYEALTEQVASVQAAMVRLDGIREAARVRDAEAVASHIRTTVAAMEERMHEAIQQAWVDGFVDGANDPGKVAVFKRTEPREAQ